MTSKRILVIGGTGAQGFAVVQALLNASPAFKVRVLSRNPDATNTKAAFADLPAVEFAKGSFMDFDAVKAALQDCYGVFVNTDGFTVNEQDELWAGVRIFEIANSIPTLRHFVYASIDYYLQLTGFDVKYGAHHTNGKGRVNSYLQSQTSSTSETGLTWTILNTGAYAEDLFGGPLMAHIEEDGTRTFAFPLGDGHLPIMSLQDMGVFTLKVFQDRERWSGETLNLVSEFATGRDLAEALTKTAGVKAVYKNISFEEWAATLSFADAPVATMDPEGITVAQNFAMWWPGFQNSILLPTRDMKLLKEINPDLETVEGWMKRVGYDGTRKGVLKGWIDAGIGPEA